MQNIETGYRPEFLDRGIPLLVEFANANDLNEEELSKLFLANQREAQMLPYDLQRKQLEVPGLQYEAGSTIVGIPRGLVFPLGFGISTRLTGRG